jgi:serine/threonine protein kinase
LGWNGQATLNGISVMEDQERLTRALADGYRIERGIGSGGMATVYLAEDLKHHRQVAVKVLKPELGAVMGTDRLLAEIRTTANLSLPHILSLHDSGDADGRLFYVMPYVEGESLRQKLDRDGQLSVEEAVRVAVVGEGADRASGWLRPAREVGRRIPGSRLSRTWSDL